MNVFFKLGKIELFLTQESINCLLKPPCDVLSKLQKVARKLLKSVELCDVNINF